MQGQDTGGRQILQVYKPQTQRRGLRYQAVDFIRQPEDRVLNILDHFTSASTFHLKLREIPFILTVVQRGLLATTKKQILRFAALRSE